MDISINEIKQILNEELSVADVLKDKKELIKQQHLKLEDIDKKINEFIKRRKVKVSLSQDQEDKDTTDYLFFNQEVIKYHDVMIPYQDIQYFKLSNVQCDRSCPRFDISIYELLCRFRYCDSITYL